MRSRTGLFAVALQVTGCVACGTLMKNSLGLVVVTSLALVVPKIAAQDVTVTPPSWFNESNAAGEQPPELKHRPSIDYPDEMRKASDLGYILIGQSVDAKGKRSVMFQSASHPYFRSATEFVAGGEFDMKPARKAGAPVDSFSWFAVIFNSATAKPKGPDATPRLVAVAPVFVEPKLLHGFKPPELPMVWATVKVDAHGESQGVVLESTDAEKFLPAINESLKQWRFAAARHGGVAVAAEVRVPFMVMPVMKPHRAEKMSPPKAIKKVEPDYPIGLRASRLQGEVVVEFVVTAEGRVTDAIVVRSTNPLFEEPALEAIRKWTFEPGRVDGKPVNTKLQLPIGFQMSEGGREAFSIRGGGPNPKLPPELQYDSPAKIRGVLVPIYPYELRRDNVKGKAKAVLVIDEAGRVVRVANLEASRPEFGLALTAAVEAFSFNPALKNGKPIPSLLKIEQDFSLSALPDSDAERMLSTEKKHPEKILGAKKLDHPLKPISRRPPIFPVTADGKFTEGKAIVEVIVDAEGYVRLPRIISATDPSFGYAAVQAISQWRFDPPIAKGKPTAARVAAPFEFKADQRAPETNASAETQESPSAATQ